jgi:hypothetical protein
MLDICIVAIGQDSCIGYCCWEEIFWPIDGLVWPRKWIKFSSLWRRSGRFVRVVILLTVPCIASLVCPRPLGMASESMDKNDACWSAEQREDLDMLGDLLERRILWIHKD